MRLFTQLAWYFRQEWKPYLAAIILLVVIALLQLYPPKLVGELVNAITKESLTFHALLWRVGEIALIAVAVYLLRYWWRIFLFGAAYRLAVELRERFYQQLSGQDPRFYLRHRTGDLMARATNDIDRVVFAAGEGVLTLVDSLVMGGAVLIVMSTQISWQLTLFSLLPMPIMAFVIKGYGQQLHDRFRSAQAAFSSLNDQTQQSLSAIRMIKAFGMEEQQSQQFMDIAQKTSQQNLQVARVDARFNPTIYLAVGTANLFAVAGGSWLIVHQQLTLGALTSFIIYLGLMIWPMLALAWMFNIVERGSAAYGRLQSLLAEKPQREEGSRSLPHTAGLLVVNIRKFSYPEQQAATLSHIDVTVQPNGMLGLCGATGSGKSSVLAVLQRQFDLQEGDIYYHNIPLTQIKLDEWHQRLSVVSQYPFLFSDSVRANIALGKPMASDDEIEAAARMACVHDDIIDLPQGYMTEIGERGVMLSGGQKQRIAIARALLLNSEILLLDDALSAVDSRTEQRILHHLRQWSQQHTVIISAHRLSALTECDEILVLQHGTVGQRGSHEQLINQHGWYQDMYRYQQIAASLTEGDESLQGNA